MELRLFIAHIGRLEYEFALYTRGLLFAGERLKIHSKQGYNSPTDLGKRIPFIFIKIYLRFGHWLLLFENSLIFQGVYFNFEIIKVNGLCSVIPDIYL